jgi:L-lactate dehydrogenase complex protein LldF
VSTFCGRCESVCPVEIPLVKLMRQWRDFSFVDASAGRSKALMRAWAFLARRPPLYHAATRMGTTLLAAFARGRGVVWWLPFAQAWTRYRDLPAPQGGTFQARWARRQREGAR